MKWADSISDNRGRIAFGVSINRLSEAISKSIESISTCLCTRTVIQTHHGRFAASTQFRVYWNHAFDRLRIKVFVKSLNILTTTRSISASSSTSLFIKNVECFAWFVVHPIQDRLSALGRWCSLGHVVEKRARLIKLCISSSVQTSCRFIHAAIGSISKLESLFGAA